MTVRPRRIILIGTSFGGVSALERVLPGLSPELPAPVVVVQHRSREADDGLCEFLRDHCRLPVAEPNDKDEVEPGRVYLAPRDYHLLVEDGRFALSVDAPVTYARPSIDVLFESAADVYGAGAVGVVLTGANRDG
ncbi:MAG TPA: chemotaxis protein CheB, partial [Pyrinomonadaceae bacterium]